MHRVTPGCAASEEEADEARDIVEAEGINNSGSNEEIIPQEHIPREHSGMLISVIAVYTMLTWIIKLRIVYIHT